MYFNTTYSREEFLRLFQTKMCPTFIREERPLQLERKTAYFIENKIFRLGTVTLDQEISVLEIQQRSSRDPRITLTKDAFKILDDNGIDTAIVIFYSPDNTSYRLSLLTTKYVDWDKKTTSSYKRFSYILGPGEKTKTPEKQLLRPITDYDDLVSRFDVEVVRKDFFEKYLELYVRLYKEIKKDQEFEQVLVSQNIDIVSFTKNLLGKIIFLYFIQQKGWLGLGHKEKEYGKGNKDFMRVMRDNFKYQNESMSTEKTGYFYNDYLEWLFFAGLNIDRRDQDDWFPNLKMKVPYLNGGLFKEEYEGRESNIAKIDNNIFSNVETKGDEADGILDVFDRYNFTVDEDSLYDSDIAVDPEMLGRIFEKMISISKDNIDEVVELYNNKGKKTKIDFGKELNKKLGAFYTPREIVHYMTKESLIAYLINNISGDKESNEKLIRALFGLKEKFLINAKELENTEFEGDILSQLKDRILEIDEALKKVKILDPAVGSGAFPMGILHEISSIRYYSYGVFHEKFKEVLDEYKNSEGNLSLYKFKKEIILNNIYGVDIDPGAIDIARLRFWLSLVVEEETPEPLPNFEFKFVCANTLIPLEDEKEQRSLGEELNIDTIKKYMRFYYNAQSNKEKDKHKKDIENYLGINKESLIGTELKSERRRQLESYRPFDTKHSNPFFDPSLMMGEGRGFDIVIANPPYIQLQKNGGFLANMYQDKGYKTFARSGDIYALFYEFSYEVLKEGGISTFITSNKWMRAGYGEKLREYLAYKTSPLMLVDLGPDIFDTATVDSNILIGRKGKTKNYLFKGLNLSQEKNVENITQYHDNAVDMGKISSDIWAILSPIEKSIKEKIERVGTPLKNRDISINYGIKTGFNEAFIIDGAKKDELIAKDPKSAEIIRPILRGRDIQRNSYNFEDLWLISTHNGYYNSNGEEIERIKIEDYPIVKEYLDIYLEKLQKRADQGDTEYNLRSCAYMEDFNRQKIVYSEIVRQPQFFLDKEGHFFVEATSFLMTGSHLSYLIYWLNSPIVAWIFKKFYAGGGLGEDGFRYKKAFLEDLPIPLPKANLVDISDEKIISIYGLNDDEIKFISSSVSE